MREYTSNTTRFTPLEARILEILASYNGQVCSYTELNKQLYGNDEADPLALFIRHIRMKIESDPLHPRVLLTIQGVGYQLTVVGTPGIVTIWIVHAWVSKPSIRATIGGVGTVHIVEYKATETAIAWTPFRCTSYTSIGVITGWGIMVYQYVAWVHPLEVIEVHAPYAMGSTACPVVPCFIDTMFIIIRVIAVYTLDRNHVDFPVKTGRDGATIHFYICPEPISICPSDSKGSILID
jgi:hypothetical protein